MARLCLLRLLLLLRRERRSACPWPLLVMLTLLRSQRPALSPLLRLLWLRLELLRTPRLLRRLPRRLLLRLRLLLWLWLWLLLALLRRLRRLRPLPLLLQLLPLLTLMLLFLLLLLLLSLLRRRPAATGWLPVLLPVGQTRGSTGSRATPLWRPTRRGAKRCSACDARGVC